MIGLQVVKAKKYKGGIKENGDDRTIWTLKKILKILAY